MSNDRDLAKLSKLLGKLKKIEPREGFDKRFWTQFEIKTNLLPTPGAFLPMPAIAACVVGVALAGFLALQLAPVDHPQITVEQNTVVSQNTVGARHAVPLRENDTIKTDSSGWTVLELADRYQIKLLPDSEITVKKLKSKWFPGHTEFTLQKGQVLVDIGGPQHIKYPLQVRAPGFLARAMGTQFAVSESSVSVLTGTVRVNPAHVSAPIDVHGGYKFDSASRTTNPNTLSTLKDQFQFSKKNRVILMIPMSSTRVQQLLKPCALYLRIESTHPLSEYLPQIAAAANLASDTKDKELHYEIASKIEAIANVDSDLDRVSLYLFLGSYYAFIEKYDDALRLFDKVASDYPDSSMASLALMAKATLFQERLGQPDRAAPILEKIRERYPDSYEAQIL